MGEISEEEEEDDDNNFFLSSYFLNNNALNSSICRSEYTVPDGLFGEFNIIARVFIVMAFSNASISNEKSDFV
jgi:hypothetical protein